MRRYRRCPAPRNGSGFAVIFGDRHNCGSDDRYEQEVDARGGYGPNLLPISGLFEKQPRFRVEVCGACGLTEWFVPERFLPKLKDAFAKVSD